MSHGWMAQKWRRKMFHVLYIRLTIILREIQQNFLPVNFVPELHVLQWLNNLSVPSSPSHTKRNSSPSWLLTVIMYLHGQETQMLQKFQVGGSCLLLTWISAAASETQNYHQRWKPGQAQMPNIASKLSRDWRVSLNPWTLYPFPLNAKPLSSKWPKIPENKDCVSILWTRNTCLNPVKELKCISLNEWMNKWIHSHIGCWIETTAQTHLSSLLLLQEACYRWSICVRFKLVCWNLMANVMVLGGRILGDG